MLNPNKSLFLPNSSCWDFLSNRYVTPVMVHGPRLLNIEILKANVLLDRISNICIGNLKAFSSPQQALTIRQYQLRSWYASRNTQINVEISAVNVSSYGRNTRPNCCSVVPFCADFVLHMKTAIAQPRIVISFVREMMQEREYALRDREEARITVQKVKNTGS